MEFPVAVFDLKKYLFKEKLLINYLLLILEYKIIQYYSKFKYKLQEVNNKTCHTYLVLIS